MGVLTAIPNEEGVELLKEELYNRIEKFALVDDSGETYFTDTVHAIFFDTNGVLTISALIPKEEHFTRWNKWVKILSDDNKIIAEIETPAIQFVKGVGGEQTIKLTVSGQAGEVVFKKDEYLTFGELDGLYISAIEALTTKVFQLEDKLLEKGVI
jgi:hypothetical protein